MRSAVDLIAQLANIVGRDGILTTADLAARDPGVDPRNFGAGLLVRPATTDQAARLLRFCQETRIGVVPQGGRTGLAGGAESHPGEIILSLERLNRIESLDSVSRTAIVGAGVTLTVLTRAAAEHGLSPGIDFGGRDSATVGGMVSTNAGGVAAFRLGTMRDRVLGLEVVLADGSVLTDLGRVRKRNEGFAIFQLFIGAEGTLGVVTRVSLALVEAEGPLATALVAVSELGHAVKLCDSLQRTRGLSLAAIEIMSGNHAVATSRAAGDLGIAGVAGAGAYLLLVEASAASAADAENGLVSFLANASERGSAVDALFAQNESQRQLMWRIREDWAVDRERPGGLWYDVSVPLAHLPAYVYALEIRLREHDPSLALYIVGHLGDGNVHLTINSERAITDRYEEIAALVTQDLGAVGGSFSAEHGIGLEKKATLGRLASPTKVDLMRRLKSTLDPAGIMNPGKVLPD